MKFLDYTQATPALVWTITHNFGQKPVADTWVDVGGVITKILPKKVTNIDDNTLEIEFSVARAGTTRLASGAYNFVVGASDGIDLGVGGTYANAAGTYDNTKTYGTVTGGTGQAAASGSSPTIPTSGDGTYLTSPFSLGATTFSVIDEFNARNGILDGRAPDSYTAAITYGHQEIYLPAQHIPADATSLDTNTTYTLTVSINGGTTQTITVAGADATTFADLVSVVNGQLVGGTMGLFGYYLIVRSNTPNTGSTVSIGFSDDLISGLNATLQSAVDGGTDGTGLLWTDKLSYAPYDPATIDTVAGGYLTLGGNVADSNSNIYASGEFVSPNGMYIETKFNAPTAASVFLIGLNIGTTGISIAANEIPQNGTNPAVRIDAVGYNGYFKADGSNLDGDPVAAAADGTDPAGASLSYTRDRYYSEPVDARGRILRLELTPTQFTLYIDGVVVLSQTPRFPVNLFATQFPAFGSDLATSAGITLFKSGNNDDMTVDFVRAGPL